MPGLVKSVAVAVGDTVADNQEVCVVEAMKMQNSLVSLSTGKVGWNDIIIGLRHLLD